MRQSGAYRTGGAHFDWKRKDALAGGWRRADEVVREELAGGWRGLRLRSRFSQLHQNHCGRQGSNRNQRVHHDAQLAVVGVGLVGMKVRDLSHGEQRQQDKAHARNKQRECLPGAALSAEMCRKSCQRRDLAVSILHKHALVLTENQGVSWRKLWLL